MNQAMKEEYERTVRLCEKQAQEIERLNKWADSFSDAQIKERQTGEMYQRELRSEIAEKDRKLAEQLATIKELEKQVICDHDWHEQDDSFSHEFGTELIVYDLCEKCGATKECEPYDYDD